MGGDHVINAPHHSEILRLLRLKIAAMELSELDPDAITEATSLSTCIGDSIDVVEFLLEVEALFDLEIPDRVASKFTTMGSIVDFIERKTRL